MAIETFNPYNDSKIGDYDEDSDDVVRNIFKQVNEVQPQWSKSIDDRIAFLKKEVVPRFKKEKENLARIMSSEMGKPISQSRAEIDKSINMTEYFCEVGSQEKAEKLIPLVKSGMVFVNKVVASDARVPFGGVKKSGYGRELSKFGILEFTNFRTVWIQ